MKSRILAGRYPILMILILVVAMLACNAPTGGDSSEVLTLVADQLTSTAIIQNLTLTPAAEDDTDGDSPDSGDGLVETATPTTAPGVTPSATVCSYWSSFEDDLTVPDGTQFAPGEEFEKTWRMNNLGCLSWSAGTQLVFVDGDQMGAPASVSVNNTATGGAVDISVKMTAPTTPGKYEGYWKLRSPDGVLFGSLVFVKIEVVKGDEPTPTPTTDPSAVQKPDLQIKGIDPDFDLLFTNSNMRFEITVRNSGNASSVATTMKVDIEGQSSETLIVSALAPSVQETIEVYIGYTTAGDYKLTFTLDPDDKNDESDEDNNATVTTFSFYNVKTYSAGSATIGATDCLDLDDNLTVICDGASDLFWHIVDVDEKYLETQNGAAVTVYGVVEPGYGGCAELAITGTQLDGSPADPDIPTGTYLCIVTSDGHIAQLYINTYGDDLEVSYLVWYLEQ